MTDQRPATAGGAAGLKSRYALLLLVSTDENSPRHCHFLCSGHHRLRRWLPSDGRHPHRQGRVSPRAVWIHPAGIPQRDGCTGDRHRCVHCQPQAEGKVSNDPPPLPRRWPRPNISHRPAQPLHRLLERPSPAGEGYGLVLVQP